MISSYSLLARIAVSLVITMQAMQPSFSNAQYTSRMEKGVFATRIGAKLIAKIQVGESFKGTTMSDNHQLVELDLLLHDSGERTAVGLNQFTLQQTSAGNVLWQSNLTGFAVRGNPYIVPANMTITPGTTLATDSFKIAIGAKGAPWMLSLVADQAPLLVAFIVPKEALGKEVTLRIGSNERPFLLPNP